MRNIIICAALSSVFLGGCYDYEGARRTALVTGEKHCESEGKQYQIVSEKEDTKSHAAILVGHCLSPGDPGY
jgi:hypothetical protein